MSSHLASNRAGKVPAWLPACLTRFARRVAIPRVSLYIGGDSGPAIIPEKPAESLLIIRVSAVDAETRMPPEGEGEQLDSRQLTYGAPFISRTSRCQPG